MTITDPISRTARLTAAARARESRRADALFVDPFAEALAGPDGFDLMDRLEATSRPPGPSGQPENPYIVIRTRLLDDFLSRTLSTQSVRQVVLVAAGLDSRAFRLAPPEHTAWFELDRPEVLQAKQEVLDRLGAKTACDRRVLGLDLAHPWADALVGAGYDRAAPSVWLVEGLLPYLDEPAVRALLQQTAELAAPGSALATDIPGRGFLVSPWTQAYRQALEREGAPWKFGTDEPEALLASYGWSATVVRPGEDGANWGRWPYFVAPRSATHVPQNYIATAVRT